VVAEQIQQQESVAVVVLCARGEECVAVGGRHGWRHRVQDQVIVLAEHIDDGAAFLFDGDGGRRASKALAERGSPKLDGFGSVFEFSDFDAAASSGDGRNDVLLRGPVDGCKCSEDRFGRRGRKRRHEKLHSEASWPGSGESLIVVV